MQFLRYSYMVASGLGRRRSDEELLFSDASESDARYPNPDSDPDPDPDALSSIRPIKPRSGLGIPI